MPSTVTLRNQAAHMKHLSLGVVVINIPPTLDGEPGVSFTPANENMADRLVVSLNDIKLDWIDTGELQVTGIDYGPAALEAARGRIRARAAAAPKRAEGAKAQAGNVPPPPPPPPAPVDDPPTDEVPAPPPAAIEDEPAPETPPEPERRRGRR